MLDTAADALPLRGRSQLLTFTGQLLLEGPTPMLMAMVSPEERLRQAFPFAATSVDEEAAVFHQLFSYDVHPYASVMMDDEGRVGGRVSAAIHHFYQKAGYAPDLRSEPADHLGHALGFLGYLDGEEADAADDDVLSGDIQAARTVFVDQIMRWWWPPLMVALQRTGREPYASMTTWLTALFTEMADGFSAPMATDTPPFPSAPHPLEDPSAGLRDIAAHLLVPVYTGLVLTRQDIRRLAHQFEAPSGFGTTTDQLENLLRSAFRFDTGDALLSALHQWLDEAEREYVELGSHSRFGAPAAFWQERVHGTRAMLATITSALERLVDTD